MLTIARFSIFITSRIVPFRMLCQMVWLKRRRIDKISEAESVNIVQCDLKRMVHGFGPAMLILDFRQNFQPLSRDLIELLTFLLLSIILSVSIIIVLSFFDHATR
jgi:hypothetical protein